MKHEISTLIERDGFWSRVEKYGTHFARARIRFGKPHQCISCPASPCFRRDHQIVDMQIRPACQGVDWSHSQDADKFAAPEGSDQLIPGMGLSEGSSEKLGFVKLAQFRDNREGLRPLS